LRTEEEEEADLLLWVATLVAGLVPTRPVLFVFLSLTCLTSLMALVVGSTDALFVRILRLLLLPLLLGTKFPSDVDFRSDTPKTVDRDATLAPVSLTLSVSLLVDSDRRFFCGPAADVKFDTDSFGMENLFMRLATDWITLADSGTAGLSTGVFSGPVGSGASFAFVAATDFAASATSAGDMFENEARLANIA